jgi:CheY-like chemotaxis protein
MAKKLLLADDSQTIQRVVDIVLGSEGFQVAAYGNGAEALKAIESIMPDIILADIDMPGLNGYQLCEKVRGDGLTSHIPVILLAGAFEPFDEDYMKKVGADDYILKPFESGELISKVKSLVAHQSVVGPAVVEEPVVDIKPVALAVEQPAGLNEWNEPSAVSLAGPDGADTADFEEELKQSMRILEQDINRDIVAPPESTTPEAMSIEEIARMVKDAVGVSPDSPGKKTMPAVAPQKEVPGGIPAGDAGTKGDIARDSARELTSSVKSAVEETLKRQLAEALPDILLAGISKAMKEMTDPLQGLINAEIKKVVPDLAERIIKQEIEKITSELR